MYFAKPAKQMYTESLREAKGSGAQPIYTIS
jgi:hypothetical protein